MSINTAQLSHISGATVDEINRLTRHNVITPTRRGRKGHGHLWSLPAALAVSTGQLLRQMGISGQPLYTLISVIAAHTRDELERALEETPVLPIDADVHALPALLSRDEYQRRAAEVMQQSPLMPMGLDLAKAYSKMLARIDQQEADGWAVLDKEAART